MDMSLEQYLKELHDAISAMMVLEKETNQCIKDIVYDNFWQKQSAFYEKVKRSFGEHSKQEMM